MKNNQSPHAVNATADSHAHITANTKGEHSDDEHLEPLTETALTWLVNLHSGDETEQDWLAYEQWKTANSAQLSASQAAENLWENIGPAVRKPLFSRAVTQLAVVMVVFLGMFGIGVQQQFLASPASLMADYRTLKNQGKTITLTDGSILQLDAASQADIHFSANKRQVILYGGQLHVQVAANVNRPFEVIAGDITVRALGTGFNVNHYAHSVTVTVTEHSVKISNIDTEKSVKLVQGQSIKHSDNTGFSLPVAADLSSLLAWQRGRLIFDNKPLYEVVQDMQRYSHNKIVFMDDNLKQLRVTGVFDLADVDDSEGMLQAIENTLPIKVLSLPWLTVLSAK